MEKKIINVVVVILLNERNEVLIQKKDKGYVWFPGEWCLFGGNIEEGESPIETLKRELKEEIGKAAEFVGEIEFFRVYSFRDECEKGIRDGEQHVYVTRYGGRVSDITLQEGAGYGFFAYSELRDVKIVEHDLRVLEDYFKTLV